MDPISVGAGVVAGIVGTRLVEWWRRSGETRNVHAWGPWSEPEEKSARTSFTSTVSLIQKRTCLDESCKETDVQTISTTHAGH